MTENQLISKPSRYNSLDLYKGICILFVIVTHYSWTEKERLLLLFPFWIEMAVPVFMVITGFVGCLSFEKNNLSLAKSYDLKIIIPKMLRYIIPFIPAWGCGLIVRILFYRDVFSVSRLFFDFFLGGEGPGSYYFPVMLQIVLFLPLIRWNMRRNPVVCLGVCFILNFCYEAFKTVINMNTGFYRICSFRYIFVIGYGCFLFYTQKKIIKHVWYYLGGTIGLIYIVVFNYLGVKPIITNQWTLTSLFAVMLIIPVMKILIKNINYHIALLELFGKASYNIFLVQMIFFLKGADIVYKYIPFVILRLIVLISICCIVGVLFYKLENPITKKIIKAIRN